MQKKTTRAFRTISEAGDELDLQPHVLRFWESKFPQIKPIKRGGGRRFYRPEDIEFLRGIKVLLHEEKHPIKDVQKLIRVKGAQRIIDLGQSIERASFDKEISDTVLVPQRIAEAELTTSSTRTVIETPSNAEQIAQRHYEKSQIQKGPSDVGQVVPFKPVPFVSEPIAPTRTVHKTPTQTKETHMNLEAQGRADAEHESAMAGLHHAMGKLEGLRARWTRFKDSS